jgi:hypothetical protein
VLEKGFGGVPGHELPITRAVGLCGQANAAEASIYLTARRKIAQTQISILLAQSVYKINIFIHQKRL